MGNAPTGTVIGGFERVLNVYERFPQRQLMHAANHAAGRTCISADEVALLLIARQQVGLRDEGLAQLLWIADGVRSVEALTAEGMRRVLYGLERLGLTGFEGAARPPATPGYASGAQITLLGILWERAPRKRASSLDAWLSREYGVSTRWLCLADTASAAISKLRSLG
ncbi:UNVERIFIED_ORG: regulatory protein GemA [Shinella sp. XGS7]|nr:phage protein GemA/Gp16 family protein [Shinella sp. XGS7]